MGNEKSTASQGDLAPKLLAGGNPQIAKGDGPEVVRRYIEAMPGWKRGIGERLDALIVDAVPDVVMAVRWNSPFYGRADEGWFVSFHCLTKYVKVAFFRGASLDPVPPVDSKDANTRYHHLHEGDEIDAEQITSWVTQAAALPGWGTN